MFSILIVDKAGQFSNIKTTTIDNLYKKIGLKTETGFMKHCEWNVSTQEYSNLYVDFYGKKIGKATYENKYEFPPPVDNQIFFGKCILVGYTKKNKMNFLKDNQKLILARTDIPHSVVYESDQPWWKPRLSISLRFDTSSFNSWNDVINRFERLL